MTVTASFCMVLVTWLLKSIVAAMRLWPRISLTTLGWTPEASSNVARLCRNSWNLTCGIPTRLRRGR
jgi:hypothetical protein